MSGREIQVVQSCSATSCPGHTKWYILARGSQEAPPVVTTELLSLQRDDWIFKEAHRELYQAKK